MDFDVGQDPVAAVRLGVLSYNPEQGGLLIRSLLTEQADLSAVERFAQFHEHIDVPLQVRYYSALIPTAPPSPGQQLAFEVDLDRCRAARRAWRPATR